MLVLSTAASSSFSRRSDAWTLNQRLSKLSHSRMWREALQLVSEESVQRCLDDKHVNVVVSACARAGRWREALELLDRLDGATVSARGASPAARAYTVAISACGRVGEWQTAVGLLEHMRALGQPPDTVTYNAVLAAMAKAGEPVRMAHLLEEMSERGVPPDTTSYTTAIDGLGRAGQVSDALRLFEQMRESGVEPDEVAYNTAITACAGGGSWSEALGLLRQMSQAKLPPSAKSFCAAMAACNNGKQWDMSLALFGAMRKHKVRLDAAAFSAAITAGSRAGKVDEALALFDELGSAADLVAYNTALHACALGGRWRHALELRRRMDAAAVVADDVTFSLLLQCLWDREEATALLEEAMTLSTFGRCLRVVDDGSWVLDLHRFSPGAAVAMTLWLLSRLCKTALTPNTLGLPPRVRIVTGWGRHAPRWRDSQSQTVRAAVAATLDACGVPTAARARRPTQGDGHIDLQMSALHRWVETSIASGLIKGCFEREDLWVLDLPQEQKAQVVARAAGREAAGVLHT